jgi:23S rRNA pseudouridine955/2504/2580 synthase
VARGLRTTRSRLAEEGLTGTLDRVSLPVILCVDLPIVRADAARLDTGRQFAVSGETRVRRLRVDDESAGQRLDNLLLRLLKGVPKTYVYRVIRSGEVRVNGGRAAADTRVQAGDEIRLPPVRLPQREAVAPAPAREFPLLLEDEHLLAIDKPAGVAVHGGSGVSSGVIEQLRQARPQARFLELVHRLDRETSGILLVACRRSALTRLQEQFRARGGASAVGKTYAALVVGDWPVSLKVLDAPLHKYLTAEGERRVRTTTAADAEGRQALTLVRVVQRLPGCTLLDVTIRTGRTHQIRVHLAAAGYPIAGDDKYGDFALNKQLARGEGVPARLERMFLHARRLRFEHPATGVTVELESPLPEDCARFLRGLQNAGSTRHNAP